MQTIEQLQGEIARLNTVIKDNNKKIETLENVKMKKMSRLRY